MHSSSASHHVETAGIYCLEQLWHIYFLNCYSCFPSKLRSLALTPLYFSIRTAFEEEGPTLSSPPRAERPPCPSEKRHPGRGKWVCCVAEQQVKCEALVSVPGLKDQCAVQSCFCLKSIDINSFCPITVTKITQLLWYNQLWEMGTGCASTRKIMELAPRTTAAVALSDGLLS